MADDYDFASLFVTHGGATAGLPPEVVRLAQQLSRIHGDVLISSETGGYHLNMASPYLLATEGRVELQKRHMAVNASRFFGFGEYEDLSPRRRDKCGLCMKSRRPYRVSELYDMAPLAQRGFPEFGVGTVMEKAATRHERCPARLASHFDDRGKKGVLPCSTRGIGASAPQSSLWQCRQSFPMDASP